jgi:hypothetical protein
MQLGFPREAAATEAVEQHQRRGAGARLAPRETIAVHVDHSAHWLSLPCSEIFVNAVDISLGAIQNHAVTVDRDELVRQVRAMGPVLAERAVRYDREASFPFENFADFRRHGLLGLCIPTRHGGLGATYADYVRVSEEIGR